MLYFILLLLIAYSASVIAVGTFGRDFLKGKEISSEKSLILYATKVNYLLVLSGFALIVLIFLMTPIKGEKPLLIYQDAVLALFITSFFSFIFAFKLTDYEYRNLVYYLVESLTDFGLLTLIGGFMVLLSEIISSSMQVLVYFGLLLLFVLTIYDSYIWFKHIKES